MELNESLANLGFSPKEIRLYLAILQHQQITPAELARVTKINRASVYHLAGGLVARGVISEELGGKKRTYIALPPTSLEVSLTSQRRDLAQQEKLVKDTIGKLSLLTAKKEYPVPKIRFVQEEQLQTFLRQQSAVWNQSILKTDPTKTWWGFQDPTLVEKYENWITWYWKTFADASELKLLSNDAPIEQRIRGKFGRRQIRTSGVSMNFSATTWVMGEYVVMLYTQQHPHYLIEIHDARFSQNMRELFKQLWETQKT